MLLLDAWLQFEEEMGTEESLAVVKRKQPKPIKRKRPVYDEEGVTFLIKCLFSTENFSCETEIRQEEYHDYIFPDEKEKMSGTLKLLQAAAQWKASMLQTEESV